MHLLRGVHIREDDTIGVKMAVPLTFCESEIRVHNDSTLNLLQKFSQIHLCVDQMRAPFELIGIVLQR